MTTQALPSWDDEMQRQVTATRQAEVRIAELEALGDAQRKEIDELKAEAGLLHKTLQEIRREVHFAHRTEDHPLKWDTLCLDVMRWIDDVTPNGTAGAKEAQRLWDETRCRVCGWPLAESADKGCVPGNCSQRPLPKERADTGYATAALRSTAGEDGIQ